MAKAKRPDCACFSTALGASFVKGTIPLKTIGLLEFWENSNRAQTIFPWELKQFPSGLKHFPSGVKQFASGLKHFRRELEQFQSGLKQFPRELKGFRTESSRFRREF